MKSVRLISVVACLAITFAHGFAQGDLGKKKGGGTGSGSSTGGGRSQGGGGSSSGGGLGRSQGGGSSSGGGLGRSQGGGSTTGGLERGKGNSGGSGSGSVGQGSGRDREGNRGGQGSQGGSVTGSNGGNSQGPLGRIEGRPQGGRGSGEVLGRGKETGRTGRTNYGGNNNQISRDGNTRAVDINSLPIDVRSGSLPSQVWREDSPRANWRTGYRQYDNRWCDDYFWYPHYSFSPSRNCTFSPWYYYSNLPPYLDCSRVIIVSGSRWSFGVGSPYRWSRNDSSGWGRWNDRNEVDEALDDLVSAWEDTDKRALSRLIPSRGSVGIYMDSAYCYSLNADDFYDLMLDNIYGSQTRRYDILSVDRSRDEIQVAAKHEYTDAWGRRCTVYHHYRLELSRSGYQITDFLVSNRRTGF